MVSSRFLQPVPDGTQHSVQGMPQSLQRCMKSVSHENSSGKGNVILAQVRKPEERSQVPRNRHLGKIKFQCLIMYYHILLKGPIQVIYGTYTNYFKENMSPQKYGTAIAACFLKVAGYRAVILILVCLFSESLTRNKYVEGDFSCSFQVTDSLGSEVRIMMTALEFVH